MDFGTDLGRFWDGFGGQDGGKLAPKPPKPTPKTNQKMYYFLESLRIDFGWILAPNLPPTWGNQPSNFRIFFALGAFLTPRWPQDAPRSPTRRPRQPLRPILESFWLICWWIFGWFLFHLGVHFGSCCFLWCWFVALLVWWFVGLLAPLSSYLTRQPPNHSTNQQTEPGNDPQRSIVDPGAGWP